MVILLESVDNAAKRGYSEEGVILGWSTRGQWMIYAIIGGRIWIRPWEREYPPPVCIGLRERRGIIVAEKDCDRNQTNAQKDTGEENCRISKPSTSEVDR